MKRIIYTDGSCRQNPGGPGGWGWVETPTNYGYGHAPSTTNQRMEVQAAIEALRANTGDVLIVTDSMYLIQCATGKWKRKANMDLWDLLLPLMQGRVVKYEWVKGHSGVRLNEVADRLAYVGMSHDTRLLDRSTKESS